MVSFKGNKTLINYFLLRDTFPPKMKIYLRNYESDYAY